MRTYYFLTILFFLIQCSNVDRMSCAVYSSSMEDDTRILTQVIEKLADDKNTPAGTLMVKIGSMFLETPYVANTLETDGDERLVVNLREMDCTTFVETCLALTKAVQSGHPGIDQYLHELTKVRYRGSKINGYVSRLHYTSDWFYENQKKNLIRDITKDIGNTPVQKTINFMTTHPGSYYHLKNNPALVAEIAQLENEISGRQRFYIPKEHIANIEDQLNDGDIVAFTTSINGLDVSHVGILLRKNNRIHLLHASTNSNKVVISDETLHEYLQKLRSVNGIMVARPL